MFRWAAIVLLFLYGACAHAQQQFPVQYPQPVIECPGNVCGLVPPNLGGQFNSPSLVLTVPPGIIYYPTGTNGASGTSSSISSPGIFVGASFSTVGGSCSLSPNSTNYVYFILNGQIVCSLSSSTPPLALLLYVVGTGPSWLTFVQGRVQLETGGFPMPEVAENPNACGSLGGPALQQQSACFSGNWLGVTSVDPTTFQAEGIGNSALEVNPQIFTARLVPGRIPQVNDYISQYGMYGSGAEDPNQITVQYASIITRIRNPNAATRDAEMDLATVDPANQNGAGTLTRLGITGGGIFCADARGPSTGGYGGAMGTRTINCDDYYIRDSSGNPQSLKAILIKAGLLN